MSKKFKHIEQSIYHNLMKGKITWAQFTKRTNDPKLAYIESLLDAEKITHRRNGESWHAPILEVDERRLSDAYAILNQTFENTNQRLDDIDDDDDAFARA